MPTLLYYILVPLMLVGAVVSLFGLFRTVPRLRKVWVHGQNRPVPIAEAPASVVAQARKSRRRWRLIFLAAFAVCTGFWAWAFLSGEVARQDAAEAAQRDTRYSAMASSLVESTEQSFIHPLTEAHAKELIMTGKTVEMTLVVPNGDEVTGKFQVVSLGRFTNPTATLEPVDDEEATRLSGLGWRPDAEQQRKWALQKVVFPELEATYGIVLEPSQRDALAVPSIVPDHLTRYGSTEMTTLLEDGTYFNGVATLIWDGEFKLIGSEGTDRAQELTRR